MMNKAEAVLPPDAGSAKGSAVVSTGVPDAKQWGVFMLLALIWGASFLFIANGLKVFTSIQVGTLRIAIAAITVMPIALNVAKRTRLKHFPLFLLSGLMGNLLPSILFSIAGGHILSSISGCLNAFTPMFATLIGILIYRLQISWWQVAGILMGLLGAVLLASTRGGFGWDAVNPYAGLVLIATLLYAFNVNFLKYRLAEFHSLDNAVMALMLAGIPAILYLAFDFDFQDRLEAATILDPAVLSVMALGVFGSAVGTLLFNRMIKQTSPVFASSVTYVIPFVAVAIGLFIGEPFSALQGMGLVATVAGVWLANKKR